MQEPEVSDQTPAVEVDAVQVYKGTPPEEVYPKSHEQVTVEPSV